MLPILYQSPEFTLYSYPLLMGIGWGMGYQIFFSEEKRSSLESKILFWGIFISAWIGAKLLFLLTTDHLPANIITQTSFWTGGGFVFYGGLIGAIIFLALFNLWKRLSSSDLYPMVLALTIGHGIGRLGCFLAGCCFGSETDWWWGVHLHGADRHPTQLLEALGLFALGLYIHKNKNNSRSLMVYLISYGLLRFVVELLRGDEIRGQWGFLTPSQWISIVLIFIGISLLFISKNRRLGSLQ